MMAVMPGCPLECGSSELEITTAVGCNKRYQPVIWIRLGGSRRDDEKTRSWFNDTRYYVFKVALRVSNRPIDNIFHFTTQIAAFEY